MEIDTLEKAVVVFGGLVIIGGAAIAIFGTGFVRWLIEKGRPKKVCPRCGARVHLHARKCPQCEWYWRMPRRAKS
jgi:ribosomal protein L40E